MGGIVNMTAYVANINYHGNTPTQAAPPVSPSNALSPEWDNMNSDSFSTTTPAAIDIESPDCVKWRVTLALYFFVLFIPPHS